MLMMSREISLKSGYSTVRFCPQSMKVVLFKLTNATEWPCEGFSVWFKGCRHNLKSRYRCVTEAFERCVKIKHKLIQKLILVLQIRYRYSKYKQLNTITYARSVIISNLNGHSTLKKVFHIGQVSLLSITRLGTKNSIE